MVMGFLAVVTSLTVFMFKAIGRASTVLPVLLFVQMRRDGSSDAPGVSAKQKEEPATNADTSRIRQGENFMRITLIYYFLPSMSRS